jgi:hypothetical protein
MNTIAQSRWNEFESAMLNAMRQGQLMLAQHHLPFMLFLHPHTRSNDVILTPVNLPLTRVKQSIQARIDSTPDQLAIDRRETRQAAQVITARTATQAADNAEMSVNAIRNPRIATNAEIMAHIRRALPFIEDNAANAQGRKMLVDILMQHTKQAEGEATQ